MTYIPNAQDPTHPTTADLAGNMAAEFQAIKAYIQSIISTGANYALMGGLRNRLMNGSFSVAQRSYGTFVIGAGTTSYTLDGWFVNSVGDTTSVSKVIGNNGISPAGASIKLAPGASITTVSLSQRQESDNCLDLITGTNITVSGMYYIDNAGIGGVPALQLLTPAVTADTWDTTTNATVAVSITPVTPLTSGTWVYFTNTVQLVTDCEKGLQMSLYWGSSAASRSISFGFLQLEKGLYASPFEQRPVAFELALCQRQYIKQIAYYGGYGLAGNTVSSSIYLPVPMRTATPTITSISNTSTNVTTPGAYVSGTNNVNGSLLSYGTVTVTGAYQVYIIFTLSCEL